MNKGIYIAVSGAILRRKNLDVFAQNIANANTSGYKKERLAFKDYLIPVDNKMPGQKDGRVMTELSGTTIDFTKGNITMTGNALDLAVNGDGFFALEGGRYTRNGSFTIDSEGYLATKEGVRVLGEGGPVNVEGGHIDITPTGDVIVDEITVDKLRVVDFRDRNVLKKTGAGMFATDSAGEPVDPQISQGFLEGSNVNAIQEMIQLMASHREFESYQKIIHAFDEASSKTINEMGK